MTDAIDCLIKEHEQIESILKCFEEICGQLRSGQDVPPEHLNLVLEFFRLYADLLHHGKEEDILIPALLEKGFPMKGGPLCTYFKELKMLEPELSKKIPEMIRLLGGGQEDVFPPDHLEGYPIPIVEEHVYGRLMARVMKKFINEPKTLADYGRKYISFLRDHIEKENRCLFPMTELNLTPVELEKMTRSFYAFDADFEKKHGLEDLLQTTRTLQLCYT